MALPLSHLSFGPWAHLFHSYFGPWNYPWAQISSPSFIPPFAPWITSFSPLVPGLFPSFFWALDLSVLSLIWSLGSYDPSLSWSLSSTFNLQLLIVRKNAHVPLLYWSLEYPPTFQSLHFKNPGPTCTCFPPVRPALLPRDVLGKLQLDLARRLGEVVERSARCAPHHVVGNGARRGGGQQARQVHQVPGLVNNHALILINLHTLVQKIHKKTLLRQ